MDEYVKREDAYCAAGLIALSSVDRKITCGEIQKIMNSIPNADVVERKRGKWEVSYLVKAFGVEPTAWYCSECHQITTFRTFFCPNCGADMR